MGDVDFKDLKTVPEKVGETVPMAASSGAHLAGLLKGGGVSGGGCQLSIVSPESEVSCPRNPCPRNPQVTVRAG